MTILTCEADRNEERFKKLRQYYARTLDTVEHTELILRGEAIRREWHARPIPKHRALVQLEKTP